MVILKLKRKAKKNSQKKRIPGGQCQVQHIRSWTSSKGDNCETHRLGGDLKTLEKAKNYVVSNLLS